MPITMMGLDVLSFMRTYNVQLAYYGKAGQVAPIDQCIAGAAPQTKEFPADVRFSMKIEQAGPAATVRLEQQVGNWETGIRYLPWQPDWCTYVRMDANSSLAFTGPLTGCNIYVAGPKANPVLFHTNSNTNADNMALNNVAKRAMALNLLAANCLGLPANTMIGGQLQRATYSGTYLGFVFGLKEAAEWKFFFNGVGAGSNTLRRIF